MTAAEDDETAPRWGLPDALVCFVAGLVGGGFGAAIVVASGADAGSLEVAIGGLVGTWVGLVGPMLWVTRSKGSGSFVTDFGLRFERGRDLIGVVIGVATQLILVPLLYLPLLPLIDDLSERLEEPAENLADRAAGDLAMILLAVFVIVGAPIVEELFYRGLLLRSLQRRFSDKVAIAASGLAFGLGHFQPIQFPALAVFGVILASLAVRYGRLGPSIFAHAAFNAVTMAVLIATR